MSQEVAQLHQWIDDHRDEMIEALRGVLRIPSKKDIPAIGAPYGEAVRQSLDYTLNLCESMGFRTKNVDGHAGHAEFGEGAEMVAAVGHLDVVPEGDRWQHEPFGAEIDAGYIYARGASDDKGPTYAALYGARALMASELPLSRRVRVIFGCDEESGFGCVHHYWEVAQEERPVQCFTPDASFPLIYAEKGIADIVMEFPINNANAPLRVIAARGGLRPNMVPDSANATLAGDTSALYTAVIELGKVWDQNVSFEPGESQIRVRAIGKSAHGSHPEAGDNAVARLARALLELDLPQDHAWLQWLVRTSDPAGIGLGVQGRDDIAGPLTCNPGVFEMDGGVARITYNIRYPVSWNIADLLDRTRPIAELAGWKIVHHHDHPPLHVPLDRDPVKTLLRVYREETGDTTTQPGTMGGGTYARATPNAVAFGPGFPGGSDGPAHEPDERIAIDSFLRAAKIYAHALYELAR